MVVIIKWEIIAKNDLFRDVPRLSVCVLYKVTRRQIRSTGDIMLNTNNNDYNNNNNNNKVYEVYNLLRNHIEITVY